LPSVYEQGRGCCLPANKSTSGNKVCCAVRKTTVKAHPNGKYSIICKEPTGPGPGPDNGNGTGHQNCPAPAKMRGSSCCYGSKCCSGESLQKGSLGWCSGRLICTAGSGGYQPALAQYKDFPGATCGSAGGGGTGSGSIFEASMFGTGEETGIPIWVWLVGGGLVLYVMFGGRKKDTTVVK